MGPALPKCSWRNNNVWALRSPPLRIPSRSILAQRHGADPVEPPDRQVLDEGRAHPRRDDEQPVGLALVGRHLGEELVVGDARGSGQTGFGANPRPDLLGDLGGRGSSL